MNGQTAPYIGANQKIMQVGAQNNAADLARMQPTTIAIYDTFDCSKFSATANNMVQFFKNVNSKDYPFANIQQNKLSSGKAFAVQQFYLLVMTKTAGVNPFTKVETIDEANGYKGLGLGDLSLLVSNTQVLESYPVAGSVGPWNRDGNFSMPATSKTAGTDSTGAYTNYRSNAVKVFPAQPIILPDQDFVAQIQFPPITPAAAADTVYLKLVLEGFGTLYTPGGTL